MAAGGSAPGCRDGGRHTPNLFWQNLDLIPPRLLSYLPRLRFLWLLRGPAICESDLGVSVSPPTSPHSPAVDTLGPLCVDLLQRLLKGDPEARIPWSDFFCHPFLFQACCCCCCVCLLCFSLSILSS